MNVVDRITDVSPSIGSTEGGTFVTITGNGFVEDDTTVTFGDSLVCAIVSVSYSSLVCITPPSTANTYNLQVRAAGVRFRDGSTFEYNTIRTPVVTSCDPTEGPAGTEITITGVGFVGESRVMIGDAECLQTGDNPPSNTTIICTTGDHQAGTFDVDVNILSKGNAVSAEIFNYAFTLDSVSPSTGLY